MCQQFRFDDKSQFRVFLAKPQKAADLKTADITAWSMHSSSVLGCVLLLHGALLTGGHGKSDVAFQQSLLAQLFHLGQGHHCAHE